MKFGAHLFSLLSHSATVKSINYAEKMYLTFSKPIWKASNRQVCLKATSSPSPSPQPGTSSSLPRRKPSQEPIGYPSAEVEEEVSHAAFARAFEDAKPLQLKVPHLQEFAAALIQRRRIPSSSGDALMHLFHEVDTDNDNILNATEISSAFKSHGVEISTDQIQALIDEFQGAQGTGLISMEQWPDFVLALATSDLHVREHRSGSQSSMSVNSVSD